MLETHKEIASQKVCIDTNILIYALHLDTPNETRKHRLANEIIESQQNIYLPYNILLET